MQNMFYASGFIFHLPSQQILLQQFQPLTSPWVLFEKEYSKSEQPDIVFKNNVTKLLDIKIDIIHPIYSYLSETTKNNCSLFYATTENLQEFPTKNDYTFQWFSFKNVSKLQATKQTKHDIIVGQRVIEAAARKARGEHTFQ